MIAIGLVNYGQDDQDRKSNKKKNYPQQNQEADLCLDKGMTEQWKADEFSFC